MKCQPNERPRKYRSQREGSVYDVGVWQAFTTGVTLDQDPPAPDAVSIDVIEIRDLPPLSPCGGSNVVTLEYRLRGEEPLVLNYAGFTPSYVMHATALAPGATPTQVTLYSTPDCLSPVLYDAAGHRTSLPERCLATRQSASPSGNGDGNVDTSASGDIDSAIEAPPSRAGERAMCTLQSAPGRSPSDPRIGVLGAALLAGLVASRRSRT
jgi:MYXO-CTERM domain-containing protein